MAGGFRKWGQNLSENSRQSAWDHARDSVAQGMFNAREDIRQKLVDEGWTGRFQPDAKVDLYNAHEQEPEPEASHDPQMSDLYGQTPEAEDKEPEM